MANTENSSDAGLVVRLSVEPGPGVDTEALADMTTRLQRELRDLDIDSVEPAKGGPLPKGAKAGAVTDFGSLIISLAPNALTEVFGLIKSWLSRPGQAGTKISMEVKGKKIVIEHGGSMTAQQIKELVRAMK